MNISVKHFISTMKLTHAFTKVQLPASIGLFLLLLVSASCKHKTTTNTASDTSPKVSADGMSIQIPDPKVDSFFSTVVVNSGDVVADLTAPGKVAAAVVSSSQGNIILFDNPDLASTYSQLTQHMNNIVQKKNIVAQKAAVIQQKRIEVQRYQDLAAHGAGTGKDVSDAKTDLLLAESDLKLAQSDLNTEQAGIMEHEALLKSGGFNPNALTAAGAGNVYITCDIAENQISKIKPGASCKLTFQSFPGEKFTGKIDNIADVIDNATRMVKVRITLPNSDNRIKAGMFALVSFDVNEGNNFTLPASSLITVQGNNYVFVKTDDKTFIMRAVTIGQQIGDRVIIYSGLQSGEKVAVSGVMQLKGLSFGY
jgi:cobalt-zinc-cadmium efflux system membrane fusion protein